MMVSNPIDLTEDFAAQTAEHDATRNAVATESGNVQTHVTTEAATTRNAVATESDNLQTHVTTEATATRNAVASESGNVQAKVTDEHTATKTLINAEIQDVKDLINNLSLSPIKSVQRGVTNLGTGVSFLGVAINAVDPAKTVVHMLGYRNATYKDFRAWIALDNSTQIGIRCDSTNVQVSTMTVSWEVIEYA